MHYCHYYYYYYYYYYYDWYLSSATILADDYYYYDYFDYPTRKIAQMIKRVACQTTRGINHMRG